MHRLYRHLPLIAIIIGLILTATGTFLWTVALPGAANQNWIAPVTIPASRNFATWGASGVANPPDAWHFQVFFAANNTAEVLLVWNLNQIVFQKKSSNLDETLETPLPRTSENWRWDWVVKNPHSTPLAVTNFTVTHHSITYPFRLYGVTFGIFGILIASTGSLMAHANWARKAD